MNHERSRYTCRSSGGCGAVHEFVQGVTKRDATISAYTGLLSGPAHGVADAGDVDVGKKLQYGATRYCVRWLNASLVMLAGPPGKVSTHGLEI